MGLTKEERDERLRRKETEAKARADVRLREIKDQRAKKGTPSPSSSAGTSSWAGSLSDEPQVPDTASGRVLQRETAPRAGKNGVAAWKDVAGRVGGDKPMATRSERRSLEVSPDWLESAMRLANEWKDDVEEEFDAEEDERIRRRAQARWATAREGVQKVRRGHLCITINIRKDLSSGTPHPSSSFVMLAVHTIDTADDQGGGSIQQQEDSDRKRRPGGASAGKLLEAAEAGPRR